MKNVLRAPVVVATLLVVRVLLSAISDCNSITAQESLPTTEEATRPSDDTLVEHTRRLLHKLVAAAEKKPTHRNRDSLDPAGDRRTEYLVQVLADAAAQLPKEHRVPAFLLALGIGLDRSELLRSHAVTRVLWKQCESDRERAKRLTVLGSVTMRGRSDTLQHFCVSAALSALLPATLVEQIGLTKELKDARGGSGFSFADYAADLAGIQFATKLQSEPSRLESLQSQFSVDSYVPELDGLPEGLDFRSFDSTYGSTQDRRFQSVQEKILQRIHSLPAYKEP